MGYSANVAACYAQDKIIELLQSENGSCGGSSNTWGFQEGDNWFFERGREQHDGAITGTIYGPSPKGKGFSRKVGSVRIEPNGNVTRWPTSTASMRKLASDYADAKYQATYCKAGMPPLTVLVEG